MGNLFTALWGLSMIPHYKEFWNTMKRRYDPRPRFAKEDRPYTHKMGKNDLFFSYLNKPLNEKRRVAFVDPAKQGLEFNTAYWNKLTPMERMQSYRSGEVDRYYVFNKNQVLPEHQELINKNKKVREALQNHFGRSGANYYNNSNNLYGGKYSK